MAVRVRLRLIGSEGELLSAAVLNGGFEVRDPQLLLPGRCAAKLLGDWRKAAHEQAMDAAGGEVTLLALDGKVVGRIHEEDREGREVSFGVLVSEHDAEVLVSDTGIDALGVRIESFAPGRWRFAEETLVRDSVAPQYW